MSYPQSPMATNNQMTEEQMNLSLAGAKESRKRSELDAQLLANRIALLKQEEEKAWKKIEETRKRATDILSLRQQNEQKYVAKEEFYKQKYESVRTAQQQNQEQRDRARQARDATRQAVMDSKRSGAMAVKEMSAASSAQRRDRDMLERSLNNEKTDFIRQQRLEHKRRLEEEKRAKQEHFRQQYEARVGREELLRARTEALVAKMEREEMELISRLQNTQLIQRSAYEELEGALGSTSQGMSATRRSGASTPAGTKVAPSSKDEDVSLHKLLREAHQSHVTDSITDAPLDVVLMHHRRHMARLHSQHSRKLEDAQAACMIMQGRCPQEQRTSRSLAPSQEEASRRGRRSAAQFSSSSRGSQSLHVSWSDRSDDRSCSASGRHIQPVAEVPRAVFHELKQRGRCAAVATQAQQGQQERRERLAHLPAMSFGSEEDKKSFGSPGASPCPSSSESSRATSQRRLPPAADSESPRETNNKQVAHNRALLKRFHVDLSLSERKVVEGSKFLDPSSVPAPVISTSKRVVLAQAEGLREERQALLATSRRAAPAACRGGLIARSAVASCADLSSPAEDGVLPLRKYAKVAVAPRRAVPVSGKPAKPVRPAVRHTNQPSMVAPTSILVRSVEGDVASFGCVSA